jgi:hypothetical protein
MHLCLSSVLFMHSETGGYKKHDLAPFQRLFNIYETPDYQNKCVELKSERKSRPYVKMRVNEEDFRRCFKNNFDTKRASKLSNVELSIVEVQLLISDTGKVIGMHIITSSGTCIMDSEIKLLSHCLSKLKIHNPNGYSIIVSERFSFSDDYFLVPKH